MTIHQVLESWRADPDISSNIVAWQTQPAAPAKLLPFPPGLSPHLVNALNRRGIQQLYTHQVTAWESVQAGHNVAVVTGTASGKTLCYNLPVIDYLLKNSEARAIYLFPIKALAQDQQAALKELLAGMDGAGDTIKPGIYDGDTPSSFRQAIRTGARLLLTNPDMLHAGILPHHTLWAHFFQQLRFIVIDEIHTYRGVFGAHVTNVLRRLIRIAHFYGSSPQFILTSATIANPAELASRLIEAPVSLVDNDGAPHGEKHFMIYNPPIIDPHLGLRVSSLLESVRLAVDLIDQDIQTIIFGRTRRSVELLLTYLRQRQADAPSTARGYRSGYLPSQRRSIEQSLRQGRIKSVVSTNALELGIDIGSLGAAVMVGYPGSIAAVRQQSGRAGRKNETSLALLVVSADPMDQYLAHHPDYFFGRTPEHALLEPNNLLILLQHIRCAAFELPFKAGDSFGGLPQDKVLEFLEVLEQSGELHLSAGRYFWMADKYPAASVSLRSASADAILLQAESEKGLTTIGKVDQASALWMTHPEAIYLHEGQPYLVESLDLTAHLARLRPAPEDYYTEPQSRTTVECLQLLKETPAVGSLKRYGELLVTTQVTGFRKVKWYTHEVLGMAPLSLPPSQLHTTGYWITLSEQTVDSLRADHLWNNDPNDYGPAWPEQRKLVLERDQRRCQLCGALEIDRPHHVHHRNPFRNFTSAEDANRLENLITVCPTCHRRIEQAVHMRSGLAGMAYVLSNLAPLSVMCAGYDLGVLSDPQSPLSQPAVVIYDNIPGGIGLSERLFDIQDELMARAHELVALCPCEDGCPSCIGPDGENGGGGKRESLAIFSRLTHQ
jgi:DEAD/DEAH box helicase domain-containing protein